MEKKELGHYYYGQISWRHRPDIAPNTAEFTLINAFSRNAFSGSAQDGLPGRGDIILDTIGVTSLAFGDGTSTGMLKYIIIDFSEKDNWILGRALDPATGKKTILHTYPDPLNTETEGAWRAGIKSIYRLALKEHINNPGGSYQLETLVDFTTSSGSPVAVAPVIVNAPENSIFSFPVAVAHPDGSLLTFRLANDVEASGTNGGFTQPGPPFVSSPLNVNSDTFMITWDTTDTVPGQLWSYQVVAESEKSKSCVDALVRIIKKSGEPPVCAGPDKIQNVLIGMPFSIDIVASDPDSLITGIEAVNLPLWAKLNIITELPASDVVVCITGTPKAKDVGFHVISIVVTDKDGNQAASCLKIKVADYGLTDEPPGVA
ncbi:hypothetical protein [Pelotomaculum propionicicum]|uniref:HYR domain-containing protein n=1 Tax=Pelotomaculum propionicicum TaxID=258475 RepID=A0A4Y7RUC4_9FIRM|nr:hypothetical protein [Pelotomaculum propionicicum]NLI14043.1 hypothetical protein [Peptococcaceae bacterium]TEB12588.1 hypothetical protein Pmgp_00919 [Pelotomaculum propionicicum]